MSITNDSGWRDVEAKAKAHEELRSINESLAAAGLQMVEITVQDRMRGGILSAIAEIEAGHPQLALKDLRNCLKL